jgi:phage baseplate assembly protein W
MSTYRGFSTVNNNKRFKVTDAALVKQDLINHFNIRKGEKLMQPDFGTIIWGLLFEPLTNDLKNAVVADITQIISYDPRVQVNNVEVNQQEYGLQILITLTYTNTNQVDALLMNFDSATQKLTHS